MTEDEKQVSRNFLKTMYDTTLRAIDDGQQVEMGMENGYDIEGGDIVPNNTRLLTIAINRALPPTERA